MNSPITLLFSSIAATCTISLPSLCSPISVRSKFVQFNLTQELAKCGVVATHMLKADCLYFFFSLWGQVDLIVGRTILSGITTRQTSWLTMLTMS
jgi:hypothetical protein